MGSLEGSIVFMYALLFVRIQGVRGTLLRLLLFCVWIALNCWVVHDLLDLRCIRSQSQL